jgi:hypothetical protein
VIGASSVRACQYRMPNAGCRNDPQLRDGLPGDPVRRGSPISV